MRELIYTILDLEKESKKTCDFCSKLYGKNNKSVSQIKTRYEKNNELIAVSVVCEECKVKFENDELPKCERCGRLQTKLDIDFSSGKYICDCVRYNEDLEEKETSPSPPRESTFAFYERQINALREEKTHLAVEAQTHLDAMEAFEVYNKKHRQELLDRIKELEAQVSKLSLENKRLKEQSEAELYKKEIAELREQLKQANQQLVQIEIPAKRQKY